jgi:alpha-tubulin suppressor-like RCC1 family protein
MNAVRLRAQAQAWKAVARCSRSFSGLADARSFLGAVSLEDAEGGELWSWGHSDDGHVREPTYLHVASPVVQVSCGLFHSAAVCKAGHLFTWGRGEGGRLGNQVQEMDRNRGGIMPLFCPAPSPVDIASASSPEHDLDDFVVAASAGGLHTLVLTRDGQMLSFGFGRWGQLGLGVDGLPGTETPQVVHRLPACKSVSAGGSHSAALSVQGALLTWGRPDNGRLGHRDSSRVNCNVPRQVACAHLPASLSHVVCGGFQSAAYGAEGGGLWMWGGGENGELGTGRQVSELEPVPVGALAGEDIVSMSIGGYHAACVTAGGDVLTWGRGAHGQLGLGADRKIVCEPTRVGGMPKATAVACGGTHTCVLTREGTLMVFGANAQGQCGVQDGPYGSAFKFDEPVQVLGPLQERRVLAVASGGSQTAAILAPM